MHEQIFQKHDPMNKTVKTLAMFLFAGTIAFAIQGCDETNKQNKNPQTPTEKEETTQSFTVNGVTFNMIKVDGGTFMMGGMEGDEEVKPCELPAHEVTLSSFYIGETEVTQELWEAVMGSNIMTGWEVMNNLDLSDYKGPKYPVMMVAAFDCQEFIDKLNELTGKKFRLPTEAEWEFAARGGNQSKGYKYAGSDNIDEVAWYRDNCDDKTHPVATKLPNELGIYDMSGNLWEWCSDWYDENYYQVSPSSNPTGPTESDEQVHRGGDWTCPSNRSRVTDRNSSIPGTVDESFGFRLAL